MTASDDRIASTPGGVHLRKVPLERYRDFKKVGQGGMGIVYWALDTELNRSVAFKVVRPDVGSEKGPASTPAMPLALLPPETNTPASQAFATLKARFLQEAWVTGGMEHPGIVPVYEVGETPEGVPYYTMRFVKGTRTLAQAIEEARGKPMEERLALLEPFLKVCDAVRYAHARGVIHRDLKPENVALGEFGEVVVLDWGLAKVKGDPEAPADPWAQRLEAYRTATDLRTVAGALGTPGYMAPEAIKGQAPRVDEQSDVYALGAILFQILTGRLPFEFTTWGELALKTLQQEAPTATSLDASAPAALSALCARSLAREKRERPADAAALAQAVRAWQAQSAADREAERHLATARAALSAAAELSGSERLKQLDHATSAARQVLDIRPDAPDAHTVLDEVEGLRETGTRERERAARRRVWRRVGVAGLALAVLATAGVALLLDARRRETEAAHSRTAAERDAKDVALTRAEGLRLAAQSIAERENDPHLALWLAAEAWKRAPGPEANDAALAALAVDRQTHELRHDLATDADIDFVSWAPDGESVLTSGSITCIWQVPSGQRLAAVGSGLQDTGWVHWPSHRLVVQEHDDDAPHVLDWKAGTTTTLPKGRLVPALPDGPGGLALIVSPDKKSLLIADTFTGAVRSKWAGTEPLDLSLPAFSEDGGILVACEAENVVASWSVVDGLLQARLELGEDEKALAVHGGRDGLVLVVTNRRAVHWNAWRGETGAEFAWPEEASFACISRDGSRVLASAEYAWTWSPSATGVTPLPRAPLTQGWLRKSALSGDGAVAAVHDEHARYVAIFDLRHGRSLAVLPGIGMDVNGLVLDERGDRLATHSEQRTVRLYDVRREAGLLVDEPSSDGTDTSWPALLDDGRILTGRSVKGEGFVVVDVVRGDIVARFPAGMGAMNSLQWSRSGERLALLRSTGEPVVSVWDVAKQEFVGDYRHPHAGAGVIGFAFSPRGTELVTNDSVAVVGWTLSDGRSTVLLGQNTYASCTFSPDGQRLRLEEGVAAVPVVLSVPDWKPVWSPKSRGRWDRAWAKGGEWYLDGGTIRLAADGSIVASLQMAGHSAEGHDVHLSPDGARVLFTRGERSEEGELWRIGAAHRIARLIGHRDTIMSAAFSRDGTCVATAGADNTVRYWDAHTGVMLLVRKTGAFPYVRSWGDRFAVLTQDERIEAWPVRPWSDVLARASQGPRPAEWERFLPPDDVTVATRARHLVSGLADRALLQAELRAFVEAAPDVPADVRAGALELCGSFLEAPSLVRQYRDVMLRRLDGAADYGGMRARILDRSDALRTLRWSEWLAERFPGQWEDRLRLGRAQFHAGQFAATLATLDDARGRKAGQSHIVLESYAVRTLWMLGRREEARKHMPALEELALESPGSEALVAKVRELVR